MAIFKVQRIRSCVQCGDVLSLKCSSCAKHPHRTPRIVSYYDWPPIIKTCEAGDHILIRCQFTGCTAEPFWRLTNKGRGGRNVYSRCFCSTSCFNRASKTKGREVPCGHCRKSVFKKLFSLTTWQASYCNNTCYFLARAKAKHGRMEAERLKRRECEEAEELRSLLHCTRCNDVIEHETIGKRNESARCRTCATVRSNSTTPTALGLTVGTIPQLATKKSITP